MEDGAYLGQAHTSLPPPLHVRLCGQRLPSISGYGGVVRRSMASFKDRVPLRQLRAGLLSLGT